ncbi:MAG: glycosyltransferase [Longimicrobiales bacterium]
MTPWMAGVLSGAWILGAFLMLFRVKLPTPLTQNRSRGRLASVVVPARNEGLNIERCLESLVQSDYEPFEVIVVDDQSSDETGALARGIDPGNSTGVQVVDGAPLPEGWLGKPWACDQGSRLARGELLLFTDADTHHHPELLSRAVAGLEADEADALTLAGEQEMGSFWERLVQPQIFFGMAQVFTDTRKGFTQNRWRRSIANGQYMLFDRRAYDGFGGHGAVRAEVVEDLRLAQIMVRDGYRLSIREAKDVFSTRMYRSLREIVGGWSKNTAAGARAVAGGWGALFMFVGALVLAPIVWTLPPLILLSGLFGWVQGPVVVWAALAYTVGSVLWGVVSRQMGAPFAYGFLHPLGSLVVWFITLKSVLRGGDVEWKGRRYQVEARG